MAYKSHLVLRLVAVFLAVLFEQFVVLGQDFNGTDTEHRGEGFIFGFDVVIIQDIAGNHFETGRVIKQLFGINPFYIFFIAVAIFDAIAGVFTQIGNLKGRTLPSRMASVITYLCRHSSNRALVVTAFESIFSWLFFSKLAFR
jgi:hypothetical protein